MIKYKYSLSPTLIYKSEIKIKSYHQKKLQMFLSSSKYLFLFLSLKLSIFLSPLLDSKRLFMNLLIYQPIYNFLDGNAFHRI